jgi:hypothetical protein
MIEIVMIRLFLLINVSLALIKQWRQQDVMSFSHISQQFTTFSCNFQCVQTYLASLTVAIVSVLAGLDSGICVKFLMTFCRRINKDIIYKRLQLSSTLDGYLSNLSPLSL